MRKIEKITMSVGFGEYDEIKESVHQPSCRKHKAVLLKSIEECGGNTTIAKVDSSFTIIDGHGRFRACKELGLPFEFEVVDDEGKSQMRISNVHSSDWKTIDYIGHNAYDDKDYEKLYKYMCTSKVPMEAISRWYNIKAKHLQNGLDISNMSLNELTKRINIMSEIKHKTGIKGTREIIRALGKLWEYKDFDSSFLVKAIDGYWLSMYPQVIDGDRTVLTALSAVYDKNTKKNKPKFFQKMEAGILN